MNLKSFRQKSSSRQFVFFLAIYFFIASFLPLSHAHNIEESHIHHHQGNHHHHHQWHHHEETQSAPVTHSESYCYAKSNDDAHHHFISELFSLYAPEKRRPLISNCLSTYFCATTALTNTSSANPHLKDFLRNIHGLFRYSHQFCRQVSGISPPQNQHSSINTAPSRKK